MDHTFCRALLKDIRSHLTVAQRKALRGSWSGCDDRSGEFQCGDFWWYGEAHCAWDARQKGIEAWLARAQEA